MSGAFPADADEERRRAAKYREHAASLRKTADHPAFAGSRAHLLASAKRQEFYAETHEKAAELAELISSRYVSV